MHSIQGYAVSPDEKSAGGRDNCSKIIISIFTGEPYDSWEVKYLARESGLKLERSSKFYWENYPGTDIDGQTVNRIPLNLRQNERLECIFLNLVENFQEEEDRLSQ